MSAPKSKWGIVVSGMAALALIISIANIAVILQQPAASPTLVTADFISIVRDQTLELAGRNLDDAQLAEASRKWSAEFKTQLESIVVENNIIILPVGIGVYGSEDITAQLKAILRTKP